MGITVLSSAGLGLRGQAAGPLAAADSAGNDFAALLTQQLLGPELLDPQALLSTTASALWNNKALDKADDTAGKPDAQNVAASDPSAALVAAGLLPDLMVGAAVPQAAEKSLPLASSEDKKPARPDAKNNGDIDASGLMAQLNLLSQGHIQPASVEAKAAGAHAQRPDVLAAPTLATSVSQEMPWSPAAAGNAAEATEEAANIAVDTPTASPNGQDFATTLAAQAGQANKLHARSDNTPPPATVSTPIHDGRWSQDFGEKIVWLAKNDQQVAQLNLNPPQLGPMHITINLNGDQASALFVSPHAEVRQAIEDAMPRLREVLADAGINLGQANVGTQLPQQQNGGPSNQSSGTSRSPNDEAILRGENEQGATTPLPAVRGGRGMVDLFA